jgi:hypothetical protein
MTIAIEEEFDPWLFTPKKLVYSTVFTTATCIKQTNRLQSEMPAGLKDSSRLPRPTLTYRSESRQKEKAETILPYTSETKKGSLETLLQHAVGENNED